MTSLSPHAAHRARPRLYEDVLSDAERARRYRQKKKAKTQSADAIPPYPMPSTAPSSGTPRTTDSARPP
ncbi:MAG: hypothetical protein MZV65_02575 [Chromatiales bacterium]|nr:hypothetical protein [Chromatiales bacterium]